MVSKTDPLQPLTMPWNFVHKTYVQNKRQHQTALNVRPQTPYSWSTSLMMCKGTLNKAQVEWMGKLPWFLEHSGGSGAGPVFHNKNGTRNVPPARGVDHCMQFSLNSFLTYRDPLMDATGHILSDGSWWPSRGDQVLVAACSSALFSHSPLGAFFFFLQFYCLI